MDLLGRWDQGEDPSVAEMKRAWVWSWDKAAALFAELRTWAAETGARVPPVTAAGKIGSESGANREKDGRPEPDATPKVDASPGESREQIGSKSGASCAGVPRSRQTETVEESSNLPPPPATAHAEPAPKARAARKPPADKSPPHPYHQRVIDAWDRVHVEATRTNTAPGLHYGGGTKAVFTGHEIRLLATVRDERVPRTEGPDGESAMQLVGTAFRRYVADALAGRAFPPGPPTVRGFCHDSAVWFGPATQHRARDAPTRRGRGSIFAALAEDIEPPDPHPDAIPTTCEVVP